VAGPADRGMYLGVYGVPNGELPPTGTNGDLVEEPGDLFRAVGPRQPSSAILAGFEGIAFDRLVSARAALVR
jgi:hypothetical protein